MPRIEYEDYDISIGDTLTTLGDIEIGEAERVFVSIDNSGFSLDQFTIDAKPTDKADYLTLYSVSSDYLAPAGLLVGTSGDITTLSAGASGWFALDVAGFYSLRCQAASGTSTGSTVAIHIGGS